MSDKNIKEGIKSTFDNVAQSYDNNKQFVISANAMTDLIELENGHVDILDLSTGTGNIAVQLAKKYPDANIIGVDISPEMLNIASKKTKEQGLKNITYTLQDVEELKLGDMKFDLITCGYGLFFYPDMDKVFYNVCSKLKDGGRFVFSTFNENAFQPYSKIFLDMLEQGYDIKPPKRLEKKQLITKEEIKDLSKVVKYKELHIHDIDIRFPMDIPEWWKLLNSTGYQGLLGELKENYAKFEKEYLEHLSSLSQDGSIEFNADSFICVISV